MSALGQKQTYAATPNCDCKSGYPLWAKSGHQHIATGGTCAMARPARFSASTILTAARLDLWRVLHIHQGYRVFRMLKIGPPIVGSSSGKSLDAWKVNDGLIERRHNRVNGCQHPSVVLDGVPTRRGLGQA